MHNVSFEESRKHVPLDALGAVHVYRPHTEFSQFVMDIALTPRIGDSRSLLTRRVNN